MFWTPLIVADQTAVAQQPPERSLHHPAARQHDEPTAVSLRLTIMTVRRKALLAQVTSRPE